MSGPATVDLDASTSVGGSVELLPWVARVADELLVPTAERMNAANPVRKCEVGIHTLEDSERGPHPRGEWRYSPDVWEAVGSDIAATPEPAYLIVLIRSPEEHAGPLGDKWTTGGTKVSITTFRRFGPGAGIHLVVYERDPDARVVVAAQIDRLRDGLLALDLGATIEDDDGDMS